MKRFEVLDNRFKLLLFVVGVATVLILVSAALRENVFTEWRDYRLEYAKILQSMADNEAAQTIADNFQIQMEQNVVPGLNKIDRCITCHTGIDDPRMVDQDQPFKTHPGLIVQTHSPEKFGCTICHRGQGRAVNSAEAKAEGYHWDYPILPTEYTESSCGVCHTTGEVEDTGRIRLALGEKHFLERGCLSCHKLNGRGGSLGPELDRIGLKIKAELPMAKVQGSHTLPQWLKEHFDNPQAIVENSQMKPPGLDPDEIEAQTTYMLSLQGRDLPESYISAAKHLQYYKNSIPDPFSGEELYGRYCQTCHSTGTYGRFDRFYGIFMPAIAGPSYLQLATKDYIRKNIRAGRPGTLMPGWGQDLGGLSDSEIDRIIDYIKSHEIPDNLRISADLIKRSNNPGLKFAGETSQGSVLFKRHCVGCHGESGAGRLAPSLNSPAFQSVSDGFIWSTIAAGRKNTAMPAFLAPGRGGFTGAEVNDLVSYIRFLKDNR